MEGHVRACFEPEFQTLCLVYLFILCSGATRRAGGRVAFFFFFGGGEGARVGSRKTPHSRHFVPRSTRARCFFRCLAATQTTSQKIKRLVRSKAPRLVLARHTLIFERAPCGCDTAAAYSHTAALLRFACTLHTLGGETTDKQKKQVGTATPRHSNEHGGRTPGINSLHTITGAHHTHGGRLSQHRISRRTRRRRKGGAVQYTKINK